MRQEKGTEYTSICQINALHLKKREVSEFYLSRFRRSLPLNHCRKPPFTVTDKTVDHYYVSSSFTLFLWGITINKIFFYFESRERNCLRQEKFETLWKLFGHSPQKFTANDVYWIFLFADFLWPFGTSNWIGRVFCLLRFIVGKGKLGEMERNDG